MEDENGGRVDQEAKPKIKRKVEKEEIGKGGVFSS